MKKIFRIFRFVQEMDDQDIRLIPIIDAGVKVERDMIYEEGVKNNYFCKKAGEVILFLQLYGFRRYPFSGYAEWKPEKMVRGQISFLIEQR